MHIQNTVKNFFVIEGLDGAGTTTQLHLIQEQTKKYNLDIVCTFEPTGNPVGTLIRQVLEKKISIDPQTLPYLFAADRHEHIFGKEGILESLKSGKMVVCDRYLFSSLAYQSLSAEISHIALLNREFPLPEAVFYLDVPVSVCESRMKTREKKDLFENRKIQEKVSIGYRNALQLFSGSDMEIILIDGTQSAEKIHENIWKRLPHVPIKKE